MVYHLEGVNETCQKIKSQLVDRGVQTGLHLFLEEEKKGQKLR